MNPDQTLSDSGLGSVETKADKHTSKLKDKNRRERRETITELLTEAEGSQLNEEVKSAIRTLQVQPYCYLYLERCLCLHIANAI